ncbi:MAG: nuclear transport factor 2 family protein [Alphaproteobacteria bacterium]|nr:nuclear transport factor 2 family protein [Alphaproteobacteria bacterium]
MRMRNAPDAADLAGIRAWFARLARCVQAADYEAAYPLFADDLIAFGTFNDFVTERPDVVREQWKNVWPTIRNFRWRLDGVQALVSADRLSAVGMGIFDSDGFREDGSRFDRRGRATVAFGRAAVGADWVALHTHMSLFRDTPSRSFGRFAGTGNS